MLRKNWRKTEFRLKFYPRSSCGCTSKAAQKFQTSLILLKKLSTRVNTDRLFGAAAVVVSQKQYRVLKLWKETTRCIKWHGWLIKSKIGNFYIKDFNWNFLQNRRILGSSSYWPWSNYRHSTSSCHSYFSHPRGNWYKNSRLPKSKLSNFILARTSGKTKEERRWLRLQKQAKCEWKQ